MWQFVVRRLRVMTLGPGGLCAGVAAIAMWVAHVPPAHSQTSSTLASRVLTFAMAQTSIAPRVVGPILVSAYGELGYRVAFVDVPQIRSLAMANENQLDGELSRMADIVKSYPNLIRVDPAVYSISPQFFTQRTDIDVTDPAQLRRHSIGIVRGAATAAGLMSGLDPVVIDDPVALFRMLGAGRLDLGIVPGDNGPLYAVMAGVDNVTAVGPALSSTELFHFLSAKNADLVPQIARILRRMSDSGELDGMRRGTLRQIYNEAAKPDASEKGVSLPAPRTASEG